MKRSALLAAVLTALAFSTPAAAQLTVTVVANCGTPPAVAYTPGRPQVATQNTLGQLCTDGGGSSGTSSVNLVAIGGVPLAYGQQLMAASIPVVIASNQSSIPVAATQTTSPWVISGAVTQGSPPWAFNLTQILGAAPSLTNPLWVFPATGATFPVSGTFFQATQPISLASGAQVSGSQPIGITPTDRTITSATGASQTAMAANAARKSLTIQNTGTANCGVNPTGGTAVIGGAGTITLFPGGAYSPRVPTLAAVTVICTAGQPLYANES